jgi:hypothetical protein
MMGSHSLIRLYYRNWSLFNTSFVAFSIYLLTFSGLSVGSYKSKAPNYRPPTGHISSTIYTSSTRSLIISSGISQQSATLGLMPHILAYAWLLSRKFHLFGTILYVYIGGLGLFLISQIPIFIRLCRQPCACYMGISPDHYVPHRY